MSDVGEFVGTIRMNFDNSGAAQATAAISDLHQSGGALDNVLSHVVVTMGDLTDAGKKVAGMMWNVVQAAADEQEAQIKLANAMKAQSVYTEDSYKANVDYASSLAMVTKYGNEEILRVMESLSKMGIHGQMLRDATQATLTLAGSTGDLSSAARLMGQTTEGVTGRLKRYGIAIDSGVTGNAALRQAIEKVNTQLPSATKDLDAFNGALKNMEEYIHEIKASLGNQFLPAVAEGVKYLKNLMVAYGDTAPAETRTGKMIQGLQKERAELELEMTDLKIKYPDAVVFAANADVKRTEARLALIDKAIKGIETVASKERIAGEEAAKLSITEQARKEAALKAELSKHDEYSKGVAADEKKIQDVERKTEQVRKQATADTIKAIVEYEKQSHRTEEERRRDFEQSLAKFQEMTNGVRNITSNLSAFQNQEIQNHLTTSTEAEDKDYQTKSDYIKQNVSDATEQKKQLDALDASHQAKLTALQDQAQRDEKQRKQDMKPILIAEAIANTAIGVTKAIAEGGLFGIVTGALVAAAGAIQIATIEQQQFAGGGIVGGNSLTGDNVMVGVNSHEMILNDGQQAQLFAMANGRAGGGSTYVIHANGPTNKAFAKQLATELMRPVNRNVKWNN